MLRCVRRALRAAPPARPARPASVRWKSAYEGEGRTTVHVLNQDDTLGLMVDCYSSYGFRLNNGVTVLGPMALFPRTILSWQVKSTHDINENSLRLFKLLEPKIDLVVVGLEANDRALTTVVLTAARNLKLNVEVLSTEHACSTFNFLNAEGRNVAAALIPPLDVQVNEDDMLQSKMRYENIFNRD